MTRMLLLPFAGGLVWLGAAVAAPTPREAVVTIDNFTFGPASVTVAPGTRVTWTNRDDIPHTILDADEARAVKSPPLDTGEHFARTFETPGVFRYFCSIHPRMQGMIVVR